MEYVNPPCNLLSEHFRRLRLLASADPHGDGDPYLATAAALNNKLAAAGCIYLRRRLAAVGLVWMDGGMDELWEGRRPSAAHPFFLPDEFLSVGGGCVTEISPPARVSLCDAAAAVLCRSRRKRRDGGGRR